MKKSTHDELSNKQLIIFAVSFTILGFVFWFFDDNSKILHPYYFSFILWIISVISICMLIARKLNGNDVSPSDSNSKENSKQDTVLSIQKTTSNVAPKANQKTSLNTSKINKKLTTCSTCGASIAKTARHCPHCGARTPGETINQVGQGIGCGILFAIIFVPCFIAFIYAMTILNAFK